MVDIKRSKELQGGSTSRYQQEDENVHEASTNNRDQSPSRSSNASNSEDNISEDNQAHESIDDNDDNHNGIEISIH